MLLNFEAEAKSLRPRRKGPEAEARDYEAKFWPWGFNISMSSMFITQVNIGV